MFCQVNLLNCENPAEIMGLFQNPLKFLQQTSISESSPGPGKVTSLWNTELPSFQDQNKVQVQQEKITQ